MMHPAGALWLVAQPMEVRTAHLWFCEYKAYQGEKTLNLGSSGSHCSQMKPFPNRSPAPLVTAQSYGFLCRREGLAEPLLGRCFLKAWNDSVYGW